MCFGLTGPISGERSHLQAPRGAYFEHLSNTSSFQVLDCSNTSSCQSNSHPYPGNPVLMLDGDPWRRPRSARYGQTTALVSVLTGPSIHENRRPRDAKALVVLHEPAPGEHGAGSQCQTSAVSGGFAGDDPQTSSRSAYTPF